MVAIAHVGYNLATFRVGPLQSFEILNAPQKSLFAFAAIYGIYGRT
jgi:hypothetical protein